MASSRTGGRSGRRARINRDDVVAAACEVLDDVGSTGFSMARVGERLGVTAMALYRHVTDRQDLEAAVLDRVLADLAAEDDSRLGWEAAVARWMHRVHDHWVRHPWIGQLITSEHTLSPSWIAALRRLADALHAAGLTDDQVAREVVLISRVVVGVTLLERQAPLPHVDAFHPAALAHLDATERAQWESLAPEMARYTNQTLFDDLVDRTIEQVQLTLSVATMPASR